MLDDHPPRAAPGHPLAFFVALLVLYVLPGVTSQLLSPIAGLAWTQIFVFLLPSVVSASGSNLLPVRALLLDRRPPPGAMAVAIAVGVVGFVAAGATMALVSSLLPRAWVRAFDLTPLFQGTPAQRALLTALAAVVAPMCEEVAFRGHLLTLLRARLPPAGAIALSALLFATLHLDPVRFVAVLFLGLVFGWLTWRSGSLWPSVAAHAVNNGAATLLVAGSGAHGTAASSADPQPLASLLALVVALAVLAPLLSWFRRLTPEPPPVELALAPANPDDHDPRFRLRRIPRWLLQLALGGIALLAVVLAGSRALR